MAAVQHLRAVRRSDPVIEVRQQALDRHPAPAPADARAVPTGALSELGGHQDVHQLHVVAFRRLNHEEAALCVGRVVSDARQTERKRNTCTGILSSPLYEAMLGSVVYIREKLREYSSSIGYIKTVFEVRPRQHKVCGVLR